MNIKIWSGIIGTKRESERNTNYNEEKKKESKKVVNVGELVVPTNRRRKRGKGRNGGWIERNDMKSIEHITV